MVDFAKARVTMVDNQVRPSDVTEFAVVQALLDVPRERFVPAGAQALAYIDDDIALDDKGRALTKPAVFAKLVQLAAIEPHDVVLIVGAATGYGAAVIARLASSVVALEEDADLAARASTNLEALAVENVAVVTGALTAGYKKEAPYDVVFVDGAIESVPAALTDQLRDQGRLVAIVGQGRAADAMIYQKSGSDVAGRSAFNAAARSLPGFARPKTFVF